MKKLLVVLLVMSFTFCLIAKASYSPALDTYFGVSFTTPRDNADYLLKDAAGNLLPTYRTSINACVDLLAGNFKFDNFEVGVGIAGLFNTRTLAAGNHILQPYMGLGPVLGLQYHFDGKASLGTKLRYLMCSYGFTRNRFDVIELEIKPGYEFDDGGLFDYGLTFPMIFSLKSDTLTYKFGIGFDFQFNLFFGGSNEK